MSRGTTESLTPVPGSGGIRPTMQSQSTGPSHFAAIRTREENIVLGSEEVYKGN